MNGTPRMSSAFPSTPQTQRRPPPQYGASQNTPRQSLNTSGLNPLKSSSTAPEADSGPLIPIDWLDAPSQRFYAFAVYLALTSWRIYDWNTLQDSEEQSLGLFMKWLIIDGIYFFGLPVLRIPWLEWSSLATLLLFMSHAVADGMLMFRISIPIFAGFAAIGRSFWGAYEMAVNEHNVNLQSIMHNESLILGRQTIHILPEGSAVLNMDREAFCIDKVRAEARLPITINATNPVSIDILRFDLETPTNETIHISKSQIKTMHKDASRLISYSENPNEPKTLYYATKKPGIYMLEKVIDETNLEVSRKKISHTVVVPCPKAMVKQPTTNKCKGELSDVELDVTGTPPLRVKYRKMVNQVTHELNFQSIQPEDFFSPLSKQDHNAITVPHRVDTEWARTRQVPVPLSEHLGQAGNWVYSIDEVQDGFGNKVIYTEKDQEDQERRPREAAQLHQAIIVHERPRVSLKGCSPQNPLKIAKGKSRDLPVQYGSTGKGGIVDATYKLEYNFTPTGEEKSAVQPKSLTIKNTAQQPAISEPGLYTLTGVSTEFCEGEVLEPASCLLQNPPQPNLTLTREDIHDKCAGSPIGLRVGLDLVGTPPFEINYKMMKKGDRHHHKHVEKVSGHRGQLELTPRTAGHYIYDFLEVTDAVYKEQPLISPDKHHNIYKLEQDVKPSASAHFVNLKDKYIACIDEQVSFEIALGGEGPFTVEYEILHSGRRSKAFINDIDGLSTTLTTEPLIDGGDYTVALASVTDRMGCKEFLKDEARISVRHSKPKVAFGSIDGQRSIEMLEGKKTELPLRLMAGEAPWTVEYTDADGYMQQIKAQRPNDRITVSKAGTYELKSLNDAICPGQVDEAADKFEVTLIDRPEMRIARGDAVEQKGNVFQRPEICEGDEDAIEMLFKGSPPYHVQYVQSVKPVSGTMSPKNKDIRAALNIASLRMDTAQAGMYEYKFNKLGDSNYDHSSQHFSPLVVQQKVHARPSAAFKTPGKTYSFCSVESEGEEVIPVTLSGLPPFSIEVEIKHLGSVKPSTVTVNNIESTSTHITIPHKDLHLGKSSVSLRRVADARGCSRTLDSSTPRVQISVHDAPTVTPLETAEDNCVGDRLNFGLSGTAPFSVFYTFEGQERKATSQSTTFRRLAEKPGTFTITGVQDSASSCRASTNLVKRIHGMPSVRVSKGQDSYVDIHEGGEAEILFEFGGSPPFEFTYTRSSNSDKKGKGGRGTVLDMRSEISDEYSMRVAAHEEGTYEVVAIKDRYCAYARPGIKVGEKNQKKLGYY